MELIFFCRDGNSSFWLEKFLDYLQSDEYYELLKRNNVPIHMETRNIYFDNINSGESIYDFLAIQ